MLQKIDECVVFKVFYVRSVNKKQISTTSISFSIEIQIHIALQLMVIRGIETLFETNDQILVRQSDHCSRSSTGSSSPRIIRVFTSNIFDCIRCTHLARMLQQCKLNVQDVYVIIFQSTAAVPGFPADAGLLCHKAACLGGKITDNSVHTFVHTYAPRALMLKYTVTYDYMA
jgi:hypothetical protein